MASLKKCQCLRLWLGHEDRCRALCNGERLDAAAPTWEVQRSRASHDHNDERVVSPGSAAASPIAGSPHGGATDEPGEPGSTRLDAAEYDERGEASHKGGVKIA